MKNFEGIVGNRALIDRLSKDINDNSLSHAYIIEGPDGSGRHTVALNTIAALCCLNKNDVTQAIPCGKCLNCRKIMAGQALDVSVISREADRATIGIEAIRNIRSDVYVAPNELEVKAYIINEADTLTAQAQNAFLLTLEEPPAYVLFFLICENSSSLLETVKSRAPTLRTERLASELIEKHILEHDKRAIQLKAESPDEFSTLISVSDGRIGYALELLNSRTRKQIFEYRQTAKDIISLLLEKNRAKAIETVISLGNKRQEISRQIIFLQHALRDLLLLKKSDDAPLCFYENREYALELATGFTSKALFSLYDASVEAVNQLERNANVRLTVMNMLRDARLI